MRPQPKRSRYFFRTHGTESPSGQFSDISGHCFWGLNSLGFKSTWMKGSPWCMVRCSLTTSHFVTQSILKVLDCLGKDYLIFFGVHTTVFLAIPHHFWDLRSRRGIEPAPSAVKAQSPNHGPPAKSLAEILLFFSVKCTTNVFIYLFIFFLVRG